jgi:hypothetical protein
MTLNIKFSRVFGTQDWFRGDPDVYNINEAEAFCQPTAPLIIRNCTQSYVTSSSRPNALVDSDQNTVSAFDRSNLTETVVATITGTAGASRHPQGVATNNYVFWIKAHSDWQGIRRYDIATGTTITLGNGDGVFDHFTLIDESKALVLVKNSLPGSYYWVKLYDFESESTTTLYEGIMGMGEYDPMGIYSYYTGGGVKSVLIVYENNPFPSHTVILKVYDHNTGGLTTVQASGETPIGSWEAMIVGWKNIALVNNKLIFGAEYDYGYDVADFFVYDFAQGTLTRVPYYSGGTWGDNPEIGWIAVHPGLNRVYFTMKYAKQDVWASLGYLDLNNNTISLIQDLPDFRDVIQGHTTAYVVPYRFESGQYFYEVTDLNNLLFEFPYGAETYRSNNIDAGERVMWTFDKTTLRLIGYPLDGSAAISIPTSVPSDILNGGLNVQGKRILLSEQKNTNTSSLRRQTLRIFHSPEAP